MVVDAATGVVSSNALSNGAYTDPELDEALQTGGFEDVMRVLSLTGRSVAAENNLPVVVARR